MAKTTNPEIPSPAPVPAASPTPNAPTTLAAPISPTEEEITLQPGRHWIDRPLNEDDGDSAQGDDAATSTASLASSILRYRTINGRTYHSDSITTNKYWGANDANQNNSLDIMHHGFLVTLDGKLNLAPLSGPIGKIVDLGTGTGSWAIDFADLHPECTVIGTDVSPIQPAWVPPNVYFEIDDFTQPWTFDSESIDYVHERWLVGCVPDWVAFYKEAYRVLKPGGWIESFACDGLLESDDNTMTKDCATSQWSYIFAEGSRKLGSTASYTIVRDELQRKYLKEAGFVNIEERLIKMPICEWSDDPKWKEVGLFIRAALETDVEGMVSYLASVLGWTQEEIIVYCAHVRREVRSLKIHGYYRCNVAWAQKPFSV
ncbi:methyltransferase type 11 [Grosmannia clavigera kw1407]|uniref:Methyltransferase type 11 n=1 Tax=Grosmannia clavigera (strain kw1407 / UAMH 11150) TaxID=655863 RepID=F0XEF4_GROCL|nr:methyltransferase type 11 [Grosmannia clavigera kw1407]EFX03842.1 methyltransferase type 11 [Grosmannia clavigera kw1407]